MTDDSDSVEAVLEVDAVARLVCPLTMGQGGSPGFCLGRRCMAWRSVLMDGKELRGYCGLAGTPIGILAQLQRAVMFEAGRVIVGARADS